MVTVRWDPVMCAGLDFMDEDHRELMGEIEGLTRAIADGKLGDVGAAAFRRLIERTRAHFLEEEAYMRDSAFPGYAEHKAEHEDFLEHLELFARRFGSGGVALHEDMMRFVTLWFLGHILGSDRRIRGQDVADDGALHAA
jgi:hemerythrin